MHLSTAVAPSLCERCSRRCHASLQSQRSLCSALRDSVSTVARGEPHPLSQQSLEPQSTATATTTPLGPAKIAAVYDVREPLSLLAIGGSLACATALLCHARTHEQAFKSLR